MKFFRILCLFMISLSACADSSQPVAHWRDFPKPYDNTVQWFRIDAPPGFKLCGPPPEFPLSNGLIIPLDTGIPCSRFLQSAPDNQPAHINTHGSPDVAEQYETTADMAVDDYYCGDESRIASELESISRTPAGQMMSGLDTVVCELHFKDGRYKRIAMAYINRSTSEDWHQFSYWIVAHARIEEKEKADALFDKTVPLFQFILPANQ